MRGYKTFVKLFNTIKYETPIFAYPKEIATTKQ